MGPILYAINVALLFELTYLLKLADDNFTLAIEKRKQQAIEMFTEKLFLLQNGCETQV